MANASDWTALKQRCADNGAKLCLRMETTDDMHVALSAIEKSFPHKMLFDIRDTLDGSAPQSVITRAVTQALAEWWA